MAPDEPAPVVVENPEGRAPLLLLCDHASAFIPAALDRLGLDGAELARHIAWDIGAAEVTRELARLLNARALLSHFSRLIVDPNRWPDDPTLVPQISDGTVVPGNRDLGAEAIEVRMATFYRPYHEAIEAEIERRLAAGETPAVVSVHSFTPVMRGGERPWQVGVLWQEDARLPVPMIARLRDRGLVVGDNEPYSARGRARAYTGDSRRPAWPAEPSDRGPPGPDRHPARGGRVGNGNRRGAGAGSG